jgi:hypothetical protein
VDFLYDEKNISLLSEYIFHELAEHLDRDHGDIYGKEDRAKSLQGIVYGPDNMLKYSLRNFIDMKAIGKKAEIEAVPARSADKDSTVERAAVAVDESAAIRLKTVDVKVVVGNVSDPSTQSGMNNSVRNFNTNVKLKFGKDGDNQQLRTFKITLDVDGRMNADETIKSFSREIEKGLAGLKDSGRLVAYMPILDKSDIARMNSETDLSAEDLLLNILTERNDPNLETIKQAITDKKLVLLKDAYTDCFRAGTTALPDVAWRFVYARQYVNLFNTENALGKKDTMLALLNLLKKVSGEDFNYPTEAELAGFMKEITDSGKTGKFFDFMSRTVIKIRPINYGEIQEYQQMMDKVAVSL